MRRIQEREPWNAQNALRILLQSDPWLGLAIVFLLTPEQWAQLRSQAVFKTIQAKVQKVIRARRRRCGCGSRSIGDDIDPEVLIRLATRSFLKRFDLARGLPKPYTLGVINQHGRAVLRSHRQVGDRFVSLPSDLVGPAGADPANDVDNADLFAKVSEEIAKLPAKYRDAVLRRYPVAGIPVEPEPTKQQLVDCSRGLAMVWKRLHALGTTP